MSIYQYGWICPKCERVYAPTVSTCAYCAPPVTTVWWKWNPDFTITDTVTEFSVSTTTGEK